MRPRIWLGALGALGVVVACWEEPLPVPPEASGGAGGDGGSGGEAPSCLPEDCPQPDGECAYAFCDGGACAKGNVAAGLACADGVCDGMGSCVGCLDADDCAEGEICAGDACVDGCQSGALDGDETDVDCGGSCPPCAEGKLCAEPADCDSGHCTDGVCCDLACQGTCEACDLAGTEGSCTPYDDGTDPESECGADSCNGAGACRCLDGTQSTGETDVDCGGPVCDGCEVGQSCAGPSDCVTGICEQSTCACAPKLAPQDDGSGAQGAVGLPDLVLSELRPGSYLELYNTTTAPITLGNVSHQLCSPFTYAALSAIAAGTIVPAEGYATIPWPTAFTDTAAGGEILLYADASFSDDTKILDFVCWGTNPHGTRKTQAENVGKWSGSCAAASAGSVHRKLSTTGITASDYDLTTGATPMTCAGQ